MFPFFYWGRILFRFMLCSGLTAISLVGLVVFFFFETLFTSTIFPNESSLALRIFGFIFFLSVLGHVFVKESWCWLFYDMSGRFTEYFQNEIIALDDIATNSYLERINRETSDVMTEDATSSIDALISQRVFVNLIQRSQGSALQKIP